MNDATNQEAIDNTLATDNSLNIYQDGKDMHFLCISDLETVLRILAAADHITMNQALSRIDQLCAKGKLMVVPNLGPVK